MVEYGKTLAMDRNVDIFRDRRDETQFFDDLKAVQQELKLLLATVEGEQIFARDFGLDVFTIAGSSDAVIRREVRIALQYDDRVQSVDNIAIDRDAENRTADLTIAVTLIDDNSLEIVQRVGA